MAQLLQFSCEPIGIQPTGLVDNPLVQGKGGTMASIEKSIDVRIPVRTVYNQWTQFEEFPHFMEGIAYVHQLDDKRLHWKANIAGKDEEWDATIVDQIPDKRISWRSTTGTSNAGAVTFTSIDTSTTRVSLRMDYEPEGFVEAVGDTLGFVSRRVQGDLERFKKFIESRGTETGAWRGKIKGSDIERKIGE